MLVECTRFALVLEFAVEFGDGVRHLVTNDIECRGEVVEELAVAVAVYLEEMHQQTQNPLTRMKQGMLTICCFSDVQNALPIASPK